MLVWECQQCNRTHVYGQKPLSHDVFEARMLTEYAKENKIVTQMGIKLLCQRISNCRQTGPRRCDR